MVMKVVVPLIHEKETLRLIKAGADEFYCGVMEKKAMQFFSYGQRGLNRRGEIFLNLTSFKKLKNVVEVAHSYNREVALTLNSFYSDEDLKEIAVYIERALECKIDAVIVCDIGLLKFLKEKRYPLKVYISTGGNCFNSEGVYFYQECGAERIILPRQMSIKEVEEITSKVHKVDFEVIIMHDRCQFIDGLCGFMHFYSNNVYNLLLTSLPSSILKKIVLAMPKAIRRSFSQKSHACLLNYSIRIENDKENHIFSHIFRTYQFFDACGGCAVYPLMRVGIKYFKISRNANSVSEKVKDVQFLKSCIDLAKDTSFSEFQEFIKAKFKEIYKRDCSSLCCYYPEILDYGI